MQIKIGERLVGDGQPCYVIAELGVNHNGSLDIAKQLIDAAKEAGADAVKFQKRTVEKCYTQAELDKPRESPWGNTTRQQKEGLEFNFRQYEEVDAHCRAVGIPWFASCWDKESVDFINTFNPPCFKIASACLTDRDLLLYTADKVKPILLSTGMSTFEEIESAIAIISAVTTQIVVMHCTSTYPSKPEELNLACITMLRRRLRTALYGPGYEMDMPIGYSGHEVGLQTTVAAVMLGACVVERHLTLSREMYGSDQAASVEPQGFARMVRDIRVCEQALGDGIKRVYDSELPIKAKLRKVETLL